jgi:hypothetical protein
MSEFPPLLKYISFLVADNFFHQLRRELLPEYFPPASEEDASAEAEAEAEGAKPEDEAEPETEPTGLSQEAAELDISSDTKKSEKDEKDK